MNNAQQKAEIVIHGNLVCPETLTRLLSNLGALNTEEMIDHDEDVWVIKVSKQGVRLLRLHHGKIIETYRRVDHAIGAVYTAAITQGFQPPRDLRVCDIPAD